MDDKKKERFLEAIEKTGICLFDDTKCEYATVKVAKRKDEYGQVLFECVLAIRWRTAGMEGGNCWGREATPITPDPEPEFDTLDTVIEAICPKIGFVQYKRILGETVQTRTVMDRGYYGNWEEYTIKYVVLEDLFVALDARGLLDE